MLRHVKALVAAIILLTFGAQAWAGVPPIPPSAPYTPPPVNQAVATRAGIMGGVSSTSLSDGTINQATYRNQHVIAGTSAVGNLVVCYPNYYWSASGKVNGPNDITVTAAIEWNSVSWPLWFAGARTITIPPGAERCAQPLAITPPAGATVYDRVYVTNAGTVLGKWPEGRAARSGFGDGNNYNSAATDVTGGTGTISGGLTGVAAYQYGPVSLTGLPASRQQAFLLYGDSIFSGAGDNSSVTSGSGYLGWGEIGLAANWPWLSATRASYRNAFTVTAPVEISNLLTNVGAVVSETGTNDAFTGVPLASMQANALTVANYAKVRNVRWYQATVTPQVTSNDGFNTNQVTTSVPDEVIRVGFNTWLRCGAPIASGAAVACGTPGAFLMGSPTHPMTGLFDQADIVEDARDSGRFRQSSTARTITCSITLGTAGIVCPAANFTSADLYWGVFVPGAGTAGANLVSRIDVVTGATTATIHTAAATTVSNVSVIVGAGTDDGVHPTGAIHQLLGAALQAAIQTGSIRGDVKKVSSNDR